MQRIAATVRRINLRTRSMSFALVVLGLAAASAEAGLVHHGKLDDSGATAVDSAGGLDGAIEGPTSVAGKVTNALKCDGSDDIVEVSNFTLPPKGTVIFWINTALARTRQRVLGTGADYEIWISNGAHFIGILDDGPELDGQRRNRSEPVVQGQARRLHDRDPGQPPGEALRGRRG